MLPFRRTLLALFISAAGLLSSLHAADPPVPKIVLIAGPKSHGPVGNGIHDYPWSVKLLKVMLDNSNVAGKVRVEYHLDGWPAKPETLDDAAAVMVISDGRDGDLYAEAPHLANPERRELMAKLMKRGCGFLTLHFSTFAPDSAADEVLDWSGGYFDWETDGKREWYSAIKTLDTRVDLRNLEHPVLRGVEPFEMQEEFYYNLRFAEKGNTPLLYVPTLMGREKVGNIVGWARERPGGGRSFSTTCGHFYDNWKQPQFRRTLLNALAWSAGLDIPAGGVTARFYTHAEITAALAGVEGTQRAVVDDEPLQVLIVTGHQYPGHKWPETTPALRAALERDPRMKVDVTEKVEDLATVDPAKHRVLIFNYCNWQRPGLSDAAKAGFVKYLQAGGGLVLIHFSNGAFHFSLPEAADSDWPEYRKICRRVWDHTAGKSGHDAYGKFIVEIGPEKHPITDGMQAFETIDELYFRQQGDEPITVIAEAKSQVTGKNEPMACVYEYGKGRICQTVLGHAAESLKTAGTSELVRRAAAWAAGREQLPRTLLRDAAPAPEQPKPAAFGPGKFGQALDARSGGAFIEGRISYRRPPLTVECWAKLTDKQPYNILVAHELKTSPTHWEVFSMAGSGHLTAYLPGHDPDHVRSSVNICDGEWHHVAMQYEAERVRLYVDAKLAADTAVRFKGGESVDGPLAIGSLVDKAIGCAGWIDDVRITRGIVPIEKLPAEPHAVSDATIGLWRFDKPDDNGRLPDESRLKNPARRLAAADAPAGTKEVGGHWGEKAIGFRWTEQDSADNRWNETVLGSSLASIIPLPEGPPVARGLSIRLNEDPGASLLFDTDGLVWRAGWTGKFLAFDPARFGLINSPKIAGTVQFFSLAPEPFEKRRFQRMFRHGSQVTVEYVANELSVRESPTSETRGEVTAFVRNIELGPHDDVRRLFVGKKKSMPEIRVIDGVPLGVWTEADRLTAIGFKFPPSLSLEVVGKDEVWLASPAAAFATRGKLLMWSGLADQLQEFAALVKQSPAAPDLAAWTKPGPAQWTEPITTRGRLGDDDGPYAVDTLTLPFGNPYNALFFTSGVDFFANGDAVLATVHGDVWRVSGIEESLQKLTWKRYATGLFQPLGLRVVADKVYVRGRDQITRLHDHDGDGEADEYENFNSDAVTSTGGHDFNTCLDTDSAGRFYSAHATQGVIRVSADGQTFDVVASGFRNPNGLGVGPGDVVTVAPQEGHWTPASHVADVRAGGYYGFGGPREGVNPPLGYFPPMVYIPRLMDNSSGGQAWNPDPRFGPLAGQLLHLSYGQCRVLLTLREVVKTGPSDDDTISQGAVLTLPWTFESGIMRGRVRPQDGALYLTGLKGWTTAAVRDGCLQRVRYTGKPAAYPVKMQTYHNGLALTYSAPLDKSQAEDVGNYDLQQWNYVYSGNYGSAEYKVSKPKETGRDPVELASATLLDEGRTIFLEIPGLQPVHQLSVASTLTSADGSPIKQRLVATIHYVPQQKFDETRIVRRAQAGTLPADVETTLRPGLQARLGTEGRRATRVSRMAAHHVSTGDAPVAGWPAGAFATEYSGYVYVPLKGQYMIEVRCDSYGLLNIADQVFGVEQIKSTGADGPWIRYQIRGRVQLRRGYNPISLTVGSQSSGQSQVHMLWEGEGFALEPIPATALFHDSRPAELQAAVQTRRGADLFILHRCVKCHETPQRQAELAKLFPERTSSAPDLAQLGRRLKREWVAHWLLTPRQLRPTATMPGLFDPTVPADRQAAADIAAWLTTDMQAADPFPPLDKLAPERVDAGERLYEDLGCIACHRLTPPSEKDEYSRRSLHFVATKFVPAALPPFLAQPGAHYPATRMPDFKLTPEEATSLAAFVGRNVHGELPPLAELATADAMRGAEAFVARRCATCHPVGETKFVPVLPYLIRASETPAGCLAIEPKRPTPDFGFSPADRAALHAYVQTRPAQETRVWFDEASRWVTALDCQACHARDAANSPRQAIVVEEGSRGLVPDPLPNLTWAGEKLRADWTARLLRGELPYKTRPWLAARMPAFPAYADVLARGLAAEHGLPPTLEETSDPHFQVDPQLAEIGNRLTQKTGGLDCRQCHAVGSQQPLGDAGTKIALGPNFTHIRERLHHEYYIRYVLDPPRQDIASRMPKLSPDGRTTPVADILEGDARRQFDALWHFINSVEVTK